MLRKLVPLLAAGLLVTGCSGGDGGSSSKDVSSSDVPSQGTESSAPVSPSATPLPVPAGVELTTQGSQLQVGELATVAYQPRQDVVGVLDITVTRLEKTSFKKSFAGWQLDDAQKAANPYFVRATVTNRGESDLGGRRVPLYIVDGTNTLVESTSFASAFRPCEDGSFPTKFPPGKTKDVCLVFLAPNKGDLTAVSFRPAQEYDPVTWTGTLEKPTRPKPEKPGQGTKNQ